MANFTNFVSLFTFLGFLCILAATSIDRWTASPLPFTFSNVPTSNQSTPYANIQTAPQFGSLAVSYENRYGFSYKTICGLNNKKEHESARAFKMNKVSQGMIAMLLLSVSCSFASSFLSILGIGKSWVITNLKKAKFFTAAAAVTTLVTWALWLRAAHELLRPNNSAIHACRFYGEWDFARVTYSFGLYVIASGLYIYLYMSLHKATTAEGHITNSAVLTSNTVLVALAAFICVFVAASGNTWARAPSTVNTIRSYEINYENYIGQSWNPTSNAHGNVHIYKETIYGVYTAFEVFQVTIPYDDHQNRAFICSSNSLELDDSGKGLVQGGRVTLGFAITATILSCFAALYAHARRRSIWISTVAMCCCVVSLLVWGIVSDPILKTRCCSLAPGGCSLGASYGLIASGALFLLVAILTEAFIGGEEVVEDVMPPYAYGMANKLESEMS